MTQSSRKSQRFFCTFWKIGSVERISAIDTNLLSPLAKGKTLPWSEIEMKEKREKEQEGLFSESSVMEKDKHDRSFFECSLESHSPRVCYLDKEHSKNTYTYSSLIWSQRRFPCWHSFSSCW